MKSCLNLSKLRPKYCCSLPDTVSTKDTWFGQYLKTAVRQEPAGIVGWFSEHDKSDTSSMLRVSADEKTTFVERRQSSCTVLMYSCRRLHSSRTVPTTFLNFLTSPSATVSVHNSVKVKERIVLSEIHLTTTGHHLSMGSHSVACHSTEVTAQISPQPGRLVLDYQPRKDERLSWPS